MLNKISKQIRGLTKKEINKDEIAEFLKINPEALKYFEEMYESTLLQEDHNNFFKVNAKQASAMNKERQDKVISEKYNIEKINELNNRIVNELLDSSNIDKSELVSLVEKEELAEIPRSERPQLTSKYIQKDIGQDSYVMLIDLYKNWKETGNIRYYHMFRQGLDILDLDQITYNIIGMNPNTMGYWLPEINKAAIETNFFKIPETMIIKVPLPILQLTRLEYTSLTPSTLKIVNDFCMKAFNLDVNKKYFIKTGTYSSKFDFRNALVQGEQEVKELGEYLLFIHHQASQMAGPLSQPSIYGVSTTNEWVVREFIEDVEDNPTIYKGMPLHTEYRVFVDFDDQEILGVSPYWREDVMKRSFLQGKQDNHKQHDYIIYKAHEETLYERYNDNKDKVLKEVNNLLPYIDLPGQWSIDIMQNGADFYIIDMALASQSALNDCVRPDKLKQIEENWMPELKQGSVDVD